MWVLLTDFHQFLWNWEHWARIFLSHLPPPILCSFTSSRWGKSNQRNGPSSQGDCGILFLPGIPAGFSILGAAAAGVRRFTHLHRCTTLRGGPRRPGFRCRGRKVSQDERNRERKQNKSQSDVQSEQENPKLPAFLDILKVQKNKQ